VAAKLSLSTSIVQALVAYFWLMAAFRKFQADHIFTGTTMLPGDKVLICDSTGYVIEVVPAQEAGEDIQRLTGLLSPGFINCHCHLELSHMRGLIPEGKGLVDFVFAVVTQRHFPEEEILEAIATAENEMLRNGTVAVGDICNNILTLGQKLKKNLEYYNFVEASGWLPAVAQQRFERSKENYEQFAKHGLASIVPHAPYSVSEPLWQLIQHSFSENVVSIHNQETPFEDQLFLQNSGDFVRMYQMMKLDTSFFLPTGKSSLQSYFGKLGGPSGVLLVHNTFTGREDVAFVKSSSLADAVSFCLCINANRYIEGAVPPVELLRENNCNIVLGTDSLASNHSLNILEELKQIHDKFPSVPLVELLSWATINGARALGMEAALGSFDKGKRPGVVLLEGVDMSKPGTLRLTQAKRLL
jgi:cytosine/adenosine deaminase-related metal-dependent hydrolase